MIRRAIALSAFAALALTAPAEAAFPGANGKLAFVRAGDIYTAQPDGTAVTPLTSGPARDADPAWSPDGTLIAFATDRDDPSPGTCTTCNWNLYVMRADGSDVRRVTSETTAEEGPSWSPDQLEIAFVKNPSPPFGWAELWKVRADGTAQTLVSDDGNDFDFKQDAAWSPGGAPIAVTAWISADAFIAQYAGGSAVPTGGPLWARKLEASYSPDGHRLAAVLEIYDDFNENFCRYGEIFVYPGETNVTNNYEFADVCLVASPDDRSPVWSPDATKIAFWSDRGPTGIWVMGADGSNPTFATSGSRPDWQPLPLPAYPRPRGASPFYVSLVPAYNACTAPNRTHGAPLAFGSCAPPVQSSPSLTFGTPDANGRPVRANAFGVMHAKLGNPSTSADEADVKLQVSVTDVLFREDLSDYDGTLVARPVLRITDRLNNPHPGGPGPGTGTATPFPFNVPCTPTPDPNAGATCAVQTTADAVVAGAVVEERRSVWQLDRFVVRDAGGAAFLTQGLFIP